MAITYRTVIKLMAAGRCYKAGQTVKEIARSANVTPQTVRRWLKTGGFLL